MTTDTTTDSDPTDEQEYKHVTLVELQAEDPRNGHDEGTQQFRAGLHEHGGEYHVRDGDEEVRVPFSTVNVFQFDRPLPKDEALDRAQALDAESEADPLDQLDGILTAAEPALTDGERETFQAALDALREVDDDGSPFETRAETIEAIASTLENRRDDAASEKAAVNDDPDTSLGEELYEAGREDAFGTAARVVRTWNDGAIASPDASDPIHPPAAIEVLGMDWNGDTLRIEYECLDCETALVARVGLSDQDLTVREPDAEYWWRRDRGERPIPTTAAPDGSSADAEAIEENVRATAATWGTSRPADRTTVVEAVAEELGESERLVDQHVRAMVRRGELVARDGTLRRVETDGGTEEGDR